MELGKAPKNRRGALQVALAEKTKLALEYRKSGMSYRAIADRIGVKSSATTYRYIQNALLNLVKEPAEGVRALEIERLDQALVAIWPKIIDGCLFSIKTMLSIMERRAKLLGLDAPAKSEFTGAGGALLDLSLVVNFIKPQSESEDENIG
jgi:hypothetical protein